MRLSLEIFMLLTRPNLFFMQFSWWFFFAPPLLRAGLGSPLGGEVDGRRLLKKSNLGECSVSPLWPPLCSSRVRASLA